MLRRPRLSPGQEHQRRYAATFSAAQETACAIRATVGDSGRRVLVVGEGHGDAGVAVEVLRLARRRDLSTGLQVGDFGFWRNGGDLLDVVPMTAAMLDLTLLVVEGDHAYLQHLERFRS